MSYHGQEMEEDLEIRTRPVVDFLPLVDPFLVFIVGAHAGISLFLIVGIG